MSNICPQNYEIKFVKFIITKVYLLGQKYEIQIHHNLYFLTKNYEKRKNLTTTQLLVIIIITKSKLRLRSKLSRRFDFYKFTAS